MKIFIKRNSKIIIIFFIYILSHLMFAKWYHSIYNTNSNHFLITEEILRSQKQAIEEDFSYKNNLAKTTIESLNKKKNALSSFIKSFSKEANNEELAQAFFNGHIYKTENIIYICSLKLREKFSDIPSLKLDIYENEKMIDSYLFEIGKYKIEDLKEININELFLNKVDELLLEIELVKSNMKKIESEKEYLWSYTDFIYFSTGYISGDIIPNSSKIRNIVLLQRFVEAILFLFLINLTFRSFSSKKVNQKPKIKHEIIVLDKNSITILKLLQKLKKLSINDLKTKTELSNKKLNYSIEELTKNNLIKVEKNDDGLFVEII